MARWIPALLILVVWGVGFASALAVRLPYPYDFEWTEGGWLSMAAAGTGMYAAPSADFVSLGGPPLYPGLLALLGGSPLAGRLLSVFGWTLAAVSLAWAPRERSWAERVVLAGAVFAMWGASGRTLDLVRPDGLALGLVALGLALTVRNRPTLATVAIALAGATQLSMLAVLPVVLSMPGNRAGRLAVGLAGSAAALVLTAWMGGSPWTWMLAVPWSHPWLPERVFPIALLELGAVAPVLWVIAAVELSKRSEWADRWRFGVPAVGGATFVILAFAPGPVPPVGAALAGGMGGGALVALGLAGVPSLSTLRAEQRTLAASVVLLGASALWTRTHAGGEPANWIPVAWGGLAWMAVTVRSGAGWAGALALHLGLTLWRTDVSGAIPSAADREAGDALVATLKRLPGPVFSPWAAWLPTLAGHPPSVHYRGIADTQAPGGPFPQVVDILQQAVDARHWGVVVTGDRGLAVQLEPAYRHRTRLVHPGALLTPVDGWNVRPTALWVPRPVAEGRDDR